ncbi:MAG: hypothetical protein CME06_12845 [Gemmatimonadetes bacterium]|nr:hypothetical protein [Gemmatimonadota bacterium]
MTHRELALALSEENFSRLVELATRKFRAEVFRVTGIQKATKRLIDPRRRREACTSRLRAWLGEDDQQRNEVAFRLEYDVLAGKLRPLIVDFLDLHDMPHEEGLTDDLAKLNELSVEELRSAVKKLSATHPPADVALYLFFTAGDADFKPLAGRLAEMPELREALAQ